jgi:hypothetical protein
MFAMDRSAHTRFTAQTSLGEGRRFTHHRFRDQVADTFGSEGADGGVGFLSS